MSGKAADVSSPVLNHTHKSFAKVPDVIAPGPVVESPSKTSSSLNQNFSREVDVAGVLDVVTKQDLPCNSDTAKSNTANSNRAGEYG